jgi:hypothetical protein
MFGLAFTSDMPNLQAAAVKDLPKNQQENRPDKKIRFHNVEFCYCICNSIFTT